MRRGDTTPEDREDLLRISAKKGRAVLFFNHDMAGSFANGAWAGVGGVMAWDMDGLWMVDGSLMLVGWWMDRGLEGGWTVAVARIAAGSLPDQRLIDCLVAGWWPNRGWIVAGS